MIDYDSLTKFMSSLVIPAIFVVTIIVVAFLWDEFGHKIKAILRYLF